MSATVLASVLLALPIVGLYFAIGARVLQRRAATGSAAFGHFALFWVGIGAYGLVEAAWGALHLAGVRHLGVGLLVLHLKILFSVAAFYGLVSYVALVLTGRRRVLAALGAMYLLLFAAAETFYMWKGPVGQHAGVWGLRLDYVQTSVEPWWTLLLVGLFVPPMLAALAYASLAAVAQDDAQRRRILLTGLTFMGFFAPMLAGWMHGGWYWWGLAEKGIGLLTGLAGLTAAMMPTTEEGAGSLAHLRALRRHQRDAALRVRADELV